MYAKGLPGEVYHLVGLDETKTLCGLEVTPIIVDRPTKTSILHLTSKLPDGPLCEGCAELRTTSVEVSQYGRDRRA